MPHHPPTPAARIPALYRLVQPRVGVVATGLSLMIVGRACGLAVPWSMRYLVDDVVMARRMDGLLSLLGLVCVAGAIQGVAGFLQAQVMNRESLRRIAELRQRLFARLVYLPVSFHDANKTGALTSRLITELESVRHVLGTGLADLVGSLLTALIVVVALLWISPLLTLTAVVTLIALAAVLGIGLRRLRPMFQERGRIVADVSARLNESLGGIRVVKAYAAEPHEIAVFRAGLDRFLRNAFETLTATSVLSVAGSFGLSMVAVATAYLGARQVLAGAMTLGEVVTFAALLAYLIAPVMLLMTAGTQMTEALAALDRTQEVLAARVETDDDRRTIALPPIRGDVVFDSVSFGYEADKRVLHNLSFRAEAGSSTALVGSSGSGKSTIIGLIASFYSPDDGRVLVDGVDIRTVTLSSYRRQLAIVLQDPFLFDGTIRENVAFARPDATEAEILASCDAAHVREFAERLPRGYDTMVGERGVRLSGGQKQRVAIARAMLADARILILDEATSSLDTESEQLVQEGLARLMQGRTSFSIAHRLSTIRRADRILVIEEGHLVEAGSHDELYGAGRRYHALYQRQHGEVVGAASH